MKIDARGVSPRWSVNSSNIEEGGSHDAGG